MTDVMEFLAGQFPILAACAVSVYLVVKLIGRYQVVQDEREMRRQQLEDERLETQREQLHAQGRAYMEYVDQRDDRLESLIEKRDKQWQGFLADQARTQMDVVLALTKSVEGVDAEIQGVKKTLAEQTSVLANVVRAMMNSNGKGSS